jgi:hypothetical protein
MLDLVAHSIGNLDFEVELLFLIEVIGIVQEADVHHESVCTVGLLLPL